MMLAPQLGRRERRRATRGEFDVIEFRCLDQCVCGGTALALSRERAKVQSRPTAIPRTISCQLKVCNLSFSELSAWRSNTCVAMPEKSADLPSLSLPLALQFAVP
jgi:hypothetical protein